LRWRRKWLSLEELLESIHFGGRHREKRLVFQQGKPRNEKEMTWKTEKEIKEMTWWRLK
jgi:hypothetical protein